jgi:hypothetical protein
MAAAVKRKVPARFGHAAQKQPIYKLTYPNNKSKIKS